MEIIYPDLKFKGKLIPLDKNKVEFIFIHHPASISASIEQIHQWHLDRDFSGCGYNEYIRKDGKVYIGRGDFIGAQVAGMNSKSYGISLEGNYDIEEGPSDELYRILAERVIEAQRRFPKATTILPHSARANTSCPGKNFSMGKLYDAITELNKKEMTAKEAINILVVEKVMLSPTYWENKLNEIEFLDKLLISMAKRLQNWFEQVLALK